MMIAVVQGGHIFFYTEEDYAQGKTHLYKIEAGRVIIKDPATVKQVLEEIFKDFIVVVRKTPGVA